MHCRECYFTGGSVDESICLHCSRNFAWPEVLGLVVVLSAYLGVALLSSFLWSGRFFRFLSAEPSSPWVNFFFPVSIADHPPEIFVWGVLIGLLVFTPLFAGVAYGPWPGVALSVLAGFSLWPLLAVFLLAGVFLSCRVLPRGKRKLVLLLAPYAPAFLFIVLAYLASARSAHRPEFLFEALSILPAVFSLLMTLISLKVNFSVMRRWFWEARLFPSWVAGFAILAGSIFLVDGGPAQVQYPIVERRFGIGGELWKEVETHAQDRSSSDPLLQGRLEEIRARSIEVFRKFARRYPTSEFAPEALYQAAQWRDASWGVSPLGQPALSLERIFPGSLEIYQTLLDRYPESGASAEGALRIAAYHLQEGDVRDAVKVYSRLVAVYGSYVPSNFDPEEPARGLVSYVLASGKRRLRRRLARYDQVTRWGEHALRFIEANGDYDGEPLRKFCELDPTRAQFPSQLDEIARLYPGTALADNIALTKWKSSAPEKSREGFEAILQRYPAGDAREEVLFLLGKACLGEGDREKARDFLRDFLAKYPRSPYYWEAVELLSELVDSRR